MAAEAAPVHAADGNQNKPAVAAITEGLSTRMIGGQLIAVNAVDGSPYLRVSDTAALLGMSNDALIARIPPPASNIRTFDTDDILGRCRPTDLFVDVASAHQFLEGLQGPHAEALTALAAVLNEGRATSAM